MEEVDKIIDKLFVLRKNGDKYLLPTTEQIEIDLIGNYSLFTYPQVRVLDYNIFIEELTVKLEGGNQNEKAFSISTEVNSEFLLSYPIKEIIIVSASRSIISRGYNDDVKNRFDESEIGYGAPSSLTLNQIENSYEKQLTTFNTKRFTKHLALPIKEVNIEEGKATFNYYSPETRSSMEFEVIHPFLTRSLDSIKNYFPNALSITKFQFEISYSILEGKLLEQTALSTDILKINDTIFEIVQSRIINDYFINSEDEIFSITEKAANLPEGIKYKGLDAESKVLDYLIDPTKTKHHYHLRYLSDKHLYRFSNLILTGKPLSFVFVLNNGKSCFLIWETYQTEEATYVWRIESEVEDKIRIEVEAILEKIKWLRKHNKEEFLKNKPDNFKRIQHNYNLPAKGFSEWKDQLLLFMK